MRMNEREYMHLLYKVKRNNKLFYVHKSTIPSYYLKEVIDEKKWAEECIRTFSMLPLFPFPFSASQKAREWGVSHVTAKKRLRKEYHKYIQINSKDFITNPHCSFRLFNILIHSNETKALIYAINDIRELSLYDINYPTREQLEGFLDKKTYLDVLIRNKVVKKLQVFSKRRWFYFVPDYILEDENVRYKFRKNNSRSCDI